MTRRRPLQSDQALREARRVAEAFDELCQVDVYVPADPWLEDDPDRPLCCVPLVEAWGRTDLQCGSTPIYRLAGQSYCRRHWHSDVLPCLHEAAEVAAERTRAAHLEEYHVSEREVYQQTVIYFAASDERPGQVKIGITRKLRHRMATLEAKPLLALTGADHLTERYWHERFADVRVDGEWFRHEGELAEFIEATLAKQAERATEAAVA